MSTDNKGNASTASGDGQKGAFTPSDISRVAVRFPPFWPEEPQVWFAQIEGIFVLSGINDDKTKFYYAVAQLDHRYAGEVKDIIVAPPANDKYEKLKAELIKKLSASREKEITKLLAQEKLGDRRPSQLLQHLQKLAGSSIPEDFIRAIWTSHMPRKLQSVMATQPDSSLHALAKLADKVEELVTPSPLSSALEKMSKQIAELTLEVKSMKSSLPTQDNVNQALSTPTLLTPQSFPNSPWSYASATVRKN